MTDKINMLVIEDGLDSQNFLSEVLAAKFPKISVRTVTGVQNGITFFRSYRPQVVVARCQPAVSPEGLLQLINREKAGTAVIVIAETEMPDGAASFPNLPFLRLIKKPVRVEHLFSTVVEAVGVITTT